MKKSKKKVFAHFGPPGTPYPGSKDEIAGNVFFSVARHQFDCSNKKNPKKSREKVSAPPPPPGSPLISAPGSNFKNRLS